MIKIKEVVIVEGKYDKIKLSNMIDGLIITTEGFGVFKDKEKQALIRRLAETRGILILTDSDGAGFVIRNFLKGTVAPSAVRHAYIPDIFGKEKRKEKPSKEGKLGVEGISEEILREAILRSGAECEQSDGRVKAAGEITKADFYACGLSGTAYSVQKREKLKQELHLPEKMTANTLLDVMNCLMARNEFFDLCSELFNSDEERREV